MCILGVNLKDLVPESALTVISDLKELKGKVIAIDAYNALYQFLAAIRQPDGSPLKDSRGRITSHLSGLFYRTINFLEAGIKPVYVLDGKPPELKAKEIEERMKIREEAERKYREALAKGRLEEARTYAQASSRLTNDMVEDAKFLVTAMGLPWIQAPSEGEAQAAYVAAKGDAWASASQDYDSLLFGAPRLLRNLTVSGRRKLPRKNIYIEIKPEVINSIIMLRELGITREQLIDIAIFLGTDYNPGGVKGIGPKTALKLIKSYGSFDKAVKAVLGVRELGFDPEAIRKIFLNPNVTDGYEIKWSLPDEGKIMSLLVDEHDFSETRVRNAIERLKKAFKAGKAPSKGLEAWFKK